VRGATRPEHPEIPPESHEYTADDIYELLETFKAIEAELYKLRRSIEQPILNRKEMLGEIETELNKLLRRSIERPANPKEEPDKTVEQPKNSLPNRDEPQPS
jgi:phage-related protein